MALGKSVWENTPWPGEENWRGDNAVDGRYTNRSAQGGQCVISYGKVENATWRVDLGGVVSISHIYIYYRTENMPRTCPTSFTSRLAGFFLYVSNTTSKQDGHLCFHEIQTVNGTPSEDQRIHCSVHGQYVIFYNERRPNVTYPSYYSEFAYYELCELEVYGCYNVGYYGPSCNKPCPINCQERRCDVNTGQCLGCVAGYQGQFCDQVCDQQTYGQQCSQSCGNCSNRETCHHINGTCLHGCNEGVLGMYCLTECNPGYYGRDCMYQCSENCNMTRRCNRFTGECDHGCKAGWTGTTCNQKCETGYFGPDCKSECGHCLNANQCHRGNGTCLRGCSAGYIGSFCREKCPSWSFGLNCVYRCNAFCRGNASCDHVTGTCIDGCIQGWNGPLCEKERQQTLSSSNDDILVISIVVPMIIVLCGSILNFIFWRRKNAKVKSHQQKLTKQKQLNFLNNTRTLTTKEKTPTHTKISEHF
uniref:Multiple epidermal growth factor-like domains protein 10 isoform X3 n=1 Tax=Crassostrea virginica TaxID=6565 RepID=A0A8B8BTU9_CRAVI|nr:multiple epidermal growth factor-like domains protein 10 isoform X3 [Crassostrea virginica]